MYEYGNLIAGQWQPGSGDAFTTCNPARPAEVVGRYTAASAEQVNEAVKAAIVAQRKWRKLPSVERGAIVEKFIAALEAKTDALAQAITLEQGKPLFESRGEIAKACGESRFMIGEASRSHSPAMPSSRPGFNNAVIRRPRGVIAALTPWNFPIMTPMRKIAPALVFGNAAILKPSEFTPATACIIGDAAKGILPDGLLQIIVGMAATGQALVSHDGIDGVAFTGSVPVGRKIYAAASQNLTEVALELGGKNAAIVNDTDDIDGCLDQIIGAAYQCAGQRCTGISRVLVRTSLATQVCDGLVKRAQAVVLGEGTKQGVTMGPMNNAAQFKKVAAMVEAGVAEGAQVLTGGKAVKIDGADGGFFYQPTILGGVTPAMSVAQEEIFGPVITVTTYDTTEEAFEILNGVEFGLTSSLFSNDHALIQRFIAESEHGMLHVNHGTVPENHMPFGGIKNSGVGAYSVGPSAAHFFTTEHAVYVKAG
jgi:acyl-CoA reductase-like NAD-dependent aldehyde dehydrogenase